MRRGVSVGLATLVSVVASVALAQAPVPTAVPQEASSPFSGAVALVITEALAPESYGAWAYRWDAVSIRVSRHMHWHLAAPDSSNRATGAEVVRNGWVSRDGRISGVSAVGDDEGVRALRFELREGESAAILSAIRMRGAAVESVAVNSYRVTPPDRRPGILAESRRCSSPQSRAAPTCAVTLTLEFHK